MSAPLAHRSRPTVVAMGQSMQLREKSKGLQTLEPARRLEEKFLDIQAVDKIFPTKGGSITALKDATLCVGTSEFVSLLGPSGCGKSTLLRCIAGLDRPSAGRIALRGEEISEPPAELGMVFQRDVLLDWLTVEKNILLPSRIKGLPLAEWTPKARALLDVIGLAGFENQFPWELSGGMRQRVAICRALLLDPLLLLMDEPFGAIDAMTRDELNLELQHIWLRNAKTVLFVTHSIHEAVFLSDRIVVMSHSPGRVVDTVTVELPRPRPLSIRETPEFGRYVARIREIFETLGMLRRSHDRH